MWYGIDFSGDYHRWTRGCNRSIVWFAKVEERQHRLVLTDLDRIQQLPGRGDEHPFVHLVAVLAQGDFSAVGIDAPFSVPRQFVPAGHDALLALVNEIPHEGRPFPEASAFVTALAGHPMVDPPQPLRTTERHWRNQGVNVRSTMWAGPRGGAAFTAACIKLLCLSGRPIWPWASKNEDGVIVEAFPAAQLRHCGLPHQGYNGNDQQAVRAQITEYIEARLAIPNQHDRNTMIANADALDAVICSFAAIAVTNDQVGHPPGNSAALEGWICVHA